MIVGKCSELAWEQSNLAPILLVPEWDATPAVCYPHQFVHLNMSVQRVGSTSQRKNHYPLLDDRGYPVDRDLSVGSAFLTNLALRSHLVKGWMCYPLDKSLSIEWITQLIF